MVATIIAAEFPRQIFSGQTNLMSGLYPTVFWWLFAISLALFLLTPLVVGWLVVRMPADYFTAGYRRQLVYWDRHWALRWTVRGAKNLLGAGLIAAGILMLFVPGQGLLTIVVGILLVDFPGKYRLERWLVTRPTVWRTINSLRGRAKCEPLVRPD
ncbi:MAG: hypothetical protein AB7G28_22340 [Pirellulales bacterium]